LSTLLDGVCDQEVTLPVHIEVNYIILASSYAGLFAVLAGVCTTVLTLVLTMGRQSGEQNELYPILVCSVLVAIVTSLIGYHLMAETSAMKIVPGHPFPGARPFIIGSINTYLTALLCMFALALLPMTYMHQTHRAVGTVALVAFAIVMIDMLLMVYVSTAAYTQPREILLKAIVSGAIALGTGIYTYFISLRKRFPFEPFLLCILFSGTSMMWSVLSYDRAYRPFASDAAFYILAVFVSIGTFTGLSLSKLVRPQSGPTVDGAPVMVEVDTRSPMPRLILKTAAGSYELPINPSGYANANTTQSTHEKPVIDSGSSNQASMKRRKRERGIKTAVVKRSNARWMRTR